MAFVTIVALSFVGQSAYYEAKTKHAQNSFTTEANESLIAEFDLYHTQAQTLSECEIQEPQPYIFKINSFVGSKAIVDYFTKTDFEPGKIKASYTRNFENNLFNQFWSAQPLINRNCATGDRCRI